MCMVGSLIHRIPPLPDFSSKRRKIFPSPARGEGNKRLNLQNFLQF